MQINSYNFGEITIDNKKYNRDVIIYPDKVSSPWQRKEGHYLELADLPEDLISQKPEIVVIGTGYSGVMEVSPEVKEYFKSQNINPVREKFSNGVKLIIEPTSTAWQTYNQVSQSKKVIALFHLTC